VAVTTRPGTCNPGQLVFRGKPFSVTVSPRNLRKQGQGRSSPRTTSRSELIVGLLPNAGAGPATGPRRDDQNAIFDLAEAFSQRCRAQPSGARKTTTNG